MHLPATFSKNFTKLPSNYTNYHHHEWFDFSLPGGPMNRWENIQLTHETDLRRVRTFFHMILLRKRVLCPRNQQPVSALKRSVEFPLFDHPLQVPEAFTSELMADWGILPSPPCGKWKVTANCNIPRRFSVPHRCAVCPQR